MYDLLIREAQGLPEDLLMEAIRFIRFLKAEEREAARGEGAIKKRRSAGAYRGKIVMAEDFDAPLEEFKEYM